MRILSVTAMVVSLAIAQQAGATGSPVVELSTSGNSTQNGVLVDRDGRFMPGLGSNVVLRKGDRVVLRTGNGVLHFSDGCVVRLNPGQMATIGSQSPCANANGGYQQVNAIIAGFGTNFATTAAVVAGVAVVGTVAGVAATSGSPVSP